MITNATFFMKLIYVNVFLLCSFLAEGQLALRDIMDANYTHDVFMLGSSSGYPQMDTESQVILDREYNYVTPTNEFKQTAIHPNPGDKYTWYKADAFVESCRKNAQVIRMHSPISPQCSDYVQDDSRTAEELATIMTEYMTALCKRYNGEDHILWMDVVNETIEKDGTWFGPKPGVDLWENPWTQIGFDNSVALAPPIYIDSAFAIANELAPDIKQMINQHGDFEEVVWEKMKKLVEYLRARGRRIDGIGWQAHIDMGWEKVPGNMDRLSSFIDWCHTNDLAFHITEFNVWLRDGNEGKLAEQATTFGTLVRLLREKSENGPTGVNFWQISCKDSQNSDRDGSIWDINHQVKPAYDAVKAAISTTEGCDDDQPKNNLVPNGGFEDGVVNAWAQKFYGGTKGGIYNSAVAHSCTNACQIQVTTAKEIGNAGVETLPLTANLKSGDKLEAVAWLKGDAGKLMRIQMIFELNDGSKRYFPSDTLVLDGSYQQMEANFDVPDDVKSFIFRVQCGASTGVYYVDDVSVELSSSSSIDDKPVALFSIAPNPVKDILHINSVEAKGAFQIYNTLGQHVRSGLINSAQTSIDVSSLPRGYYLIQINSVSLKMIKD